MGQLEALKRLAQSHKDEELAKAQIVIAGEVFSVLPGGHRLYPFSIESPCALIRLARRNADSSVPAVYCQFRNEFLVSIGPVAAHSWLLALLGEVMDVTADPTVSRIDPAVDFVTSLDMEGWGRESWVTRVRQIASFAQGGHFTGWKIGTHSNPFSLRVYDKAFELLQAGHDKGFYARWEAAGWAPWDAVWRIEGEYRRHALADFGLRTLPEVLGSWQGLWDYLVGNVVRLTLPVCTDKTRARWPLHPLWEAMAAIRWPQASESIKRVVRPSAAPKDAYFARVYRSLLTSMMGREGFDDAGMAQQRLQTVLNDDLNTEYSLTGRTPEESLLIAARVKARQYGTQISIATPPVVVHYESDTARSYRRASDGE